MTEAELPPNIGYRMICTLRGTGVNLMTGEDDHSKDWKDENGLMHHGEKNIHRFGLAYFGFGPFKIGINSEKYIRASLQNGIHKRKGLYLWDDLSSKYPNKFYWYFGSTGGNTLW